MIKKYWTRAFFWGTLAKILDAGLKFISTPLLIQFLGKGEYGIMSLAMATNGYMALLDLGINTGAIKYFSQWIQIGEKDRVSKVARTSLVFYSIIGIINFIIMLVLAFLGQRIFKVDAEQFSQLQILFLLVGGFSILNWYTSVFNQLLIAAEDIAFIQKIYMIKSVCSFLLIILALISKMSLLLYFFWFLVINSIVIIPFYVRAKRKELISSFKPAAEWKEFLPILKYSIAIFTMGIFQFTANQSRPIILGMFNNVSILSDYRIIEMFPMFIISFGGLISSVLLPQTSRLIQEGDIAKIEKLIYRGTTINTVIIALMCFPVILSAKEILIIYVGRGYELLNGWMALWVFTVFLFMHNWPVASMVLSTGKTRMLVFSSALSCIVSITTNVALSSKFGIGSAIIGYTIYILIQMSFYYFYFNKKVLHLNSLKVFFSFLIPAIVAIVAALPVIFFSGFPMSTLQALLLKSIAWYSFYGILVFAIWYNMKIKKRGFLSEKFKM
jgi:O-antigen/teichoic acid export membrane protein